MGRGDAARAGLIMPLDAYGVLLGAKAGYRRDRPDAFGRFYHGHIDVQTPGQFYNTAIDVDTERPNVRVQWRVLHLRVSEWRAIFNLPDGFHSLASNDSSGAVDYLRDPRLRNLIFVPEPIAGLAPWWRRMSEAWRVLTGATGAIEAQPALRFTSRSVRVTDATPGWKTGTDIEALTDLEAMIIDAPRVVIFGAFYPAREGSSAGTA